MSLRLAFILSNVPCVAQNVPDVGELISRLNRPDSTDRAAKQIAEVATKDAKAREIVVKTLPEMIDKPETDEVWLNAVRLAGQLKVQEAVPSLMTAFARGPLGGRIGSTMTDEFRLNKDVVAKALSQIGDPAIPAVTSLLASGELKTRRRAVLILQNMGTPAARKVLQERLPQETNPRIKELIANGLHDPGPN